jgi:hypothetical protein
MKLLLRDYLASLKEREELDAILPDLLSELGFTVWSRPQRGTQQSGVDIAAVGPDDDGERKVFLFSVKAGDLTRQDWDGSPQALRSSLNEIQDVYIRNRVPARYKDLRVVICIAFGGVVQEQLRDQLTAYIERHTNDRISFDEWNGDRIAGLLLTGILREELLPKAFRSSFQKAVAMVDEPDVSYQHFAVLARAIREAGAASHKASVRAARQLNLCVWVLFVWSRDIGNVEAAYRASELALLSVWVLARSFLDRGRRNARKMRLLVLKIIDLHLNVATELLERKFFPYVEVQHGLSVSVNSSSAVDVNLAMFEALGRIGLTGLWMKWVADLGGEIEEEAREGIVRYTRAGIAMISKNPSLLLPISDRQTTDIALFLMLWVDSGINVPGMGQWLEEMASRLDFTIRTRGLYPSTASDYRDLADHPRDGSDEYFKESTAGSTLIPLLTAWLHALQRTVSVEAMGKLVREELEHCTLQLWMPDEASEQTLYTGDGEGGRALCDLPVGRGGEILLRTILEACDKDDGFLSLSAVKARLWPIVLMACRHHRVPVPVNFWIEAMRPQASPERASNPQQSEVQP